MPLSAAFSIDVLSFTGEVPMRPWFAVLCLSLALLTPSHLRADDPPLPENIGIAWPSQNVPVLQPPPAPPLDCLRAVGPQWLETELLLGFPTELRIQWAALRGGSFALMLEGIGGILTNPFVTSDVGGIVGGGARLRIAACNGERNAFVLKPGVDIYEWFGGPGGSGTNAGADVEILWYHNCGASNRFGFELGLDIGTFFGPGGWGGWFEGPIVGGIFGLHF